MGFALRRALGETGAVTAGAWALPAVAGLLAAADGLAVAWDQKGLEYLCKPGTLAALVGDVFLMLGSDR